MFNIILFILRIPKILLQIHKFLSKKKNIYISITFNLQIKIVYTSLAL